MGDVVSRRRMKVFNPEDGKLDLRIYVDRAVVEVFAENGSGSYLEGRKQLGPPLLGQWRPECGAF